MSFKTGSETKRMKPNPSLHVSTVPLGRQPSGPSPNLTGPNVPAAFDPVCHSDTPLEYFQSVDKKEKLEGIFIKYSYKIKGMVVNEFAY